MFLNQKKRKTIQDSAEGAKLGFEFLANHGINVKTVSRKTCTTYLLIRYRKCDEIHCFDLIQQAKRLVESQGLSLKYLVEGV